MTRCKLGMIALNIVGCLTNDLEIADYRILDLFIPDKLFIKSDARGLSRFQL